MAAATVVLNTVRARRRQRGWSQLELAARAGVSRAAVSAIEVNRLVPSVATALALAAAFAATVEELFGISGRGGDAPTWAWPPARRSGRYWQARVGGRTL